MKLIQNLNSMERIPGEAAKGNVNRVELRKEMARQTSCDVWRCVLYVLLIYDFDLQKNIYFMDLTLYFSPTYNLGHNIFSTSED